ncbi:MAG TPA: FtsX-like permease family protein, partial [Longimicrobiales bacterium]|nr:FtsX-like permease family protein [Longimicrobiales bacterium]
VPPDGTPLHIHHRYVTPGYFEAMRIPLLRGRVFPGADRPEGPLEVIVDAAMARRQWPGEDPVGKRVRFHREGAEWRTVVGVVGEIEAEGDYDQGWYLPFYREPTRRSNEILHVMVRLRSADALAGVREGIREVAPALPVFGVAAMEDLRRETLSQDRIGALLTAVFAGFGLLLATVGLYSLMAYAVSLRKREIGTRIALGASRRGVLGLVMRQAGTLVAVGGLAGLGLALLMNRVLQSIVLGVRMAGPEILTPLMAVLVVVSAGAVLVPAVRAARVDPVRAFRAE